MKKSYIAGGIALALGVAGLVAPVFAIQFTGTDQLDLSAAYDGDINNEHGTPFTTNFAAPKALKITSYTKENMDARIKKMSEYLNSTAVTQDAKDNYKKALKNVNGLEITTTDADIVIDDAMIDTFLNLKAFFHKDAKIKFKTANNNNIDLTKVSEDKFNAIVDAIAKLNEGGTGKVKVKSFAIANALKAKGADVVGVEVDGYTAPKTTKLQLAIENAEALIEKVEKDPALAKKHKDRLFLLKNEKTAANTWMGNVTSTTYYATAEEVAAQAENLNNYITLLDNEIKGVKPETQKPQGNANTNNTTKPNKVSNSGSAN